MTPSRNSSISLFNIINNEIVKVINFSTEYCEQTFLFQQKLCQILYNFDVLVNCTIMSWGGCEVEGWRSVVERGVKTKAYAANPTTLNSF